MAIIVTGPRCRAVSLVTYRCRHTSFVRHLCAFSFRYQWYWALLHFKLIWTPSHATNSSRIQCPHSRTHCFSVFSPPSPPHTHHSGPHSWIHPNRRLMMAQHRVLHIGCTTSSTQSQHSYHSNLSDRPSASRATILEQVRHALNYWAYRGRNLNAALPATSHLFAGSRGFEVPHLLILVNR